MKPSTRSKAGRRLIGSCPTPIFKQTNARRPGVGGVQISAKLPSIGAWLLSIGAKLPSIGAWLLSISACLPSISAKLPSIGAYLASIRFPSCSSGLFARFDSPDPPNRQENVSKARAL